MVSLIYKILLSFDTLAFNRKIIQWSADCELTFSQQDWDKINESYMVSTTLLMIKMQSLKLLNRWFITPDKVCRLLQLQIG